MIKKLLLAWAGLVLFGPMGLFAAPWPDNLSRNERRRLHTLMQNTWEGLEGMCSKNSGLPYESTRAQDQTTPATIGLYLTSLCVAQRLDYLEKNEAEQRIERILSSLDVLPHWNRLYAQPLPVDGEARRPISNEGDLADYANLPAGIMVVRTCFPRLARRCTEFLEAVSGTLFYDPESTRLFRRFDVEKQRALDPVAPRTDDNLRLAHFLLIASRQVPSSSWPAPREIKGSPLRPIHGSLFLDPRGTPVGREEVLAAWRQIGHALNLGAPVWGWTLCPGRATQEEACTYAIIHPHVSAQALHFFPREVLHNFKALEEMGALEPGGGREGAGRWRDHINWRTGEMADYVVTEHQARLFLALANYLQRGVLWRIFQADPMARSGLRRIADCRSTEYKRGEQRKFIRALSRPMPDTFWWFSKDSLTPMAGDLLQVSLWARSLSPKPFEGFTESWRLTDRAGRVIAEGEEPFKLAPRESRKLTEIMIPTARLRPGMIWTLESQLRQNGKTIATMEREIRFRRRE